MERALDPELFSLALGESGALPSPEEVAKMLAEAEIAILLYEPEIPEELVKIGWYLHAVASSKYALRTYGVPRQRAAFRVSGHIFDLFLQKPEIERSAKLKYCFASQVAYLRGKLDPNALALHYREFAGNWEEMSLLAECSEIALSCGVALLGFDAKAVYAIAEDTETQVQRLTERWEIDSMLCTPFGAASEVAFGTRDLMSFLVYGDLALLGRACDSFQKAIRNEPSAADQISRWVAAHLLNLTDDLENASIWTALPPEIPGTVKRAFSMSEPKILTLWPPQLDLLGKEEKSSQNPLTSQVKRLFISTPTSGGKTLLAQLLIMVHLAAEGKSVCYVAPTRSLCREVRESLECRLRFMDTNIADGLPEGDWADDLLEFESGVEVMTPERLSYLIHSDSSQVLERFGMFVFDEVHMVGDLNRGWTLEEDLSYLHHATEETDHRIVLISAAIGNKTHFIQWMGKEDVVPLDSEWRGPRRVDSIWTTDVDWDDRSVEDRPRARKFPRRAHYPQYGRLHVRVSHTGDSKVFETRQSIGELIRRIDTENQEERTRDSESTPLYKMLVHIIHHLSRFGPVLVVESTRQRAIRMAEAIAAEEDPVDGVHVQTLIDLVESRLGDHPLQQVLQKGVAYHYGSLPNEIRIAIQDAVAKGSLRYLVSTTTMTEGINLPVRSVVISSQGSHRDGKFEEYITGPRLINAIGRAGRATKETEGVVVLACAEPSEADFECFTPSGPDIQITSMLAAEEALEELAAFEALERAGEDAVLELARGIVPDFLAFIWFVAAELERIGDSCSLQDIRDVLRRTLAWQQLKPEDQDRWLAAANLSLARYNNTDPTRRRRWATAGSTLGTAQVLESLAQEVAGDLQDEQAPQSAIEVVDLITRGERLQSYLQLPESPDTEFYTLRARGRLEIEVPIDVLLQQWIQGTDLVSLADEHLNEVTDINFRFEQLCDFIYDYFEVFFPWVFGRVIGWTNELLQQSGGEELLPETIPGYVRYGVDNAVALTLLLRGIQSRSLALRIADEWQSEDESGSVHAWVRSLNLADWQTRFGASTIEMQDLLDFSRLQGEGVDAKLITQGTSEIEVESRVSEFAESSASLVPIGKSMLSPVSIEVKGEAVGRVMDRDQSAIRAILNTGLPISARFSAISGEAILGLTLTHPE
jgi:superfamily II DNA/RNA helicase